MENNNIIVTTEEIICFWRDILLISFLLDIPAIILYRPVGLFLATIWVGSIIIIILTYITDEIISRIKKRKSLDKYSGLDSDY